MKQKYLITLRPETQEISIREYTELEKGEFAFVCEEIHDAEAFRNAMAGGAESLVPIVRRPNMYPRQDFGEQIAQGIIDVLNDEFEATSKEVFIDDVDAFETSEDDIDAEVVFEESDTEDNRENPKDVASSDKK